MENSLKQTVTSEILNKALQYAGESVSFNEYLNNPNLKPIKLTEFQKDMWMVWGAEHLQKRLKYTQYEAELEMSWIYYNHSNLI